MVPSSIWNCRRFDKKTTGNEKGGSDTMPEAALAPPLAGVTVVELSHSVAAAYAGRLLAVLGAETIMVEPPDGSPLRR